MKSDEKASLAPRTAGEGAPSRSREIGKAGTPSSYPKPARSKRQVSPEAAKTSAKCGRRSLGGSSTRPDEKATVFGSIRPQLTLLRLGFQHRRGFAESARSGKDGAAPTFFRGKIRAGVCAGPVARIDHAECRTALRPGSLRGSPEGLAIRQNARVTDPVASLVRARAARAWGADGSRGGSARRPGSTPRVRRSTGGGPSQVTNRAERTPCLWGEGEAGCPHAWALRVAADRPARRPKQKPPPLGSVAAERGADTSGQRGLPL